MDKPIIEIYTVQMSQWRLVKKLDIVFTDITAKSGIKSFAPDYGNVMAYKSGAMSEETYTEIYLKRMAFSKQTYVKQWEQLKLHSKIALACYCKAGVFCHRHIFKTLAETYLEEAGYAVVQKGEILPGVIK